MPIRPFSDTESALKTIYLDGNQTLFSTPCTSDIFLKWPCYKKIASVLSFSMDKEEGRYIIENRLIPKETAVEIVYHPCYLPAIIHSHEFINVICIDNGNCLLFIDGSEHHVEAGNICIIGPNISYALSACSDDADVVNVLMRRSTFEQSFGSLIARDDILSKIFMNILYNTRLNQVVVFRCGQDEKINAAKMNLYSEQNVSDSYSPRIKEAYLLLLFSLLLRYHNNDILFIDLLSKDKDEILFECIKYIEKHLKTVTLGSLSDRFGYNTTHLSRKIKEYTGLSFIEIVKTKRLEKAKIMLRNTKISINDIVEKIGYTDISHFYKSFKSQNGITPVEYRKKNQ
jgi:AraC-like DNA-binding protein